MPQEGRMDRIEPEGTAVLRQRRRAGRSLWHRQMVEQSKVRELPGRAEPCRRVMAEEKRHG